MNAHDDIGDLITPPDWFRILCDATCYVCTLGANGTNKGKMGAFTRGLGLLEPSTYRCKFSCFCSVRLSRTDRWLCSANL